MHNIRTKLLVSVWALAAMLLGFSGSNLHADEVRPAYLEIVDVSNPQNTDNPVSFEVLWKQPIVENRRLPIEPIFPANCEMREVGPPTITASALIHRWQTTCALNQGEISIKGLSTSITDVLIRFVESNGTVSNFILRPANPNINLSKPSTTSVGYLVIGIEHLLAGIDHVLFVIGLVLFIRNPWALLKTVTAFTVAHSITLGLSIYDVVSLKQGPVEAVIALSIVFLARELAQPPELRSILTQGQPWLMAFFFGLLHGLGFAGALTDIGLPEDALLSSLMLFNLGIEIGQLVIIALFLVIAWLWRKATERLNLREAYLYSMAAYGMGIVATFWTIDRTLVLF
jgi:hydrogenase/urease accessory protein HupE